jgi:hypothetical protein
VTYRSSQAHCITTTTTGSSREHNRDHRFSWARSTNRYDTSQCSCPCCNPADWEMLGSIFLIGVCSWLSFCQKSSPFSSPIFQSPQRERLSFLLAPTEQPLSFSSSFDGLTRAMCSPPLAFLEHVRTSQLHCAIFPPDVDPNKGHGLLNKSARGLCLLYTPILALAAHSAKVTKKRSHRVSWRPTSIYPRHQAHSRGLRLVKSRK